jgi:outer membrane protein OmpA-like peptidoglycan-associated protein
MKSSNVVTGMTILGLLVVGGLSWSKAQILERVTEKVREKVESKVDEKVDETIDEAFEAKKADSATAPKGKAATTNSGSTAQEEFKSLSKFDFVPGDQVIFYEDFSQDAIGDFPPNWDTDGTGEVVTIGGQNARWLKWSAGASYAPLLKKPFPDNFTAEFDILMRQHEGKEDPFFEFGFFATEKNSVRSEARAMVKITGRGAWTVNAKGGDDDEQEIGSSSQIETSALFGKTAHLSVWAQKTRLRMYVNETKVIDLPRAIPESFKYNQVRYSNNPGLNLSNDDAGEIYISNIRIAVGAPDMRSKLITEGKLVTRGILFDVNSDKIKPASYGVLKEIGAVLKDNQTVRVKIIGHTDSDGDDKSNLDLSKRRSAAVKVSLSTSFGIDASRIETDGKGESQPDSPNTTPEGKANNRRVEFIRL